MNSSLSRRAPRTVDASSNEARHGSTGGDGDSIQSSIELMPLSPPKFDRKLDVIEEYMKSTTYGDRIYEASRRDDLGTASIMGSSEAVEAIRRFNVVYFRSVSAQPTLADEAPMEEGAMEAAVPSRTSSTRSREGATINYTDGQGEMIQAVAATETLPSVSDEPPSSLFSGLQTASSITTWTSSGIEAATRSLVRLLLADKEVGSALRKGLSNSKSEAGLDSFVRTIGPPLASYAKDLQAIAQTPDQERVVEFVQIIADDASNFVHRMLDTASLSSSSSGDAAQGLSSTSASVTTPDNPIILGKLEDATSVSTDSLSKSKEANDPSVEADLSSHAREFLLSAQPLASLRATLQDLILTVPKLDPPGETDTMPTEVPLEKESAQENFAHGVEEDSGPDAAYPYTLPEFVEEFYIFMSRNATLRGARATLEQLMNTAASRRQGGPPLTDLQHSRRQSITERQETAQKRPARSESFGKRRYHRAADALPAVNRDQLGWIFSTAPRVGNGISWFRELASSIKSRISGAPHSQQGGLMQPVMLPMTELRPVEPRTTLALALLLCIDKGEVNTEFHQISLRGVVDDCGLFREIRREYYKRRKLVSRITLRSVKAVSLARFDLDYDNFADVHKHSEYCTGNSRCICLPTLELVQNSTYKCHPAPETDTGQWPPISSRKLTMQFNSTPQKLREEPRSEQKTTYNQLPKLAQDHNLRALTDQMVRAWGIHFEEGWHWITVWYLASALVWISLLAGIIWSAITGDVQSAFAVSATIIAIAPIFIGGLAVYGSR